MRTSMLLTVLLLASATATAADNGFYVGAGVGQANVEIDDLGTLSGDDFKGDDTGYKFIVGFRPLDWLGLEANYVNFGKPEDTVATLTGPQTVKTEGDGISAFAIGFLALGPVDIYAKGGIITFDTQLAGFSEEGTELAYGVGAQFRLLGLSIRAEYEIFEADALDDLSMISVGVTYTFL
jgi:Outer membrane protein beta-barrel domain